jgi:hypothetical protein
VPRKGEQCEQHRTDANRRDQEAPGHIVDNHHQRIDAGRRVKRTGQMHCDHSQSNRQRGSPRCRAGQFDDDQPNEGGDEVATD